jgi:uncharacterized protein YceK
MLLLLPGVGGLSGCGTLFNLPKQTGLVIFDTTPTEQVYGGVLRDARTVQEDWKNVISPEGANGRLDSMVGAAYVALIDLPLSALGDTLTLPITISAARKSEKTASDKPEWDQWWDPGPPSGQLTFDKIHGGIE